MIQLRERMKEDQTLRRYAPDTVAHDLGCARALAVHYAALAEIVDLSALDEATWITAGLGAGIDGALGWISPMILQLQDLISKGGASRIQYQ